MSTNHLPFRRAGIRRIVVALALIAGAASPALAGPPFICHPFELGTHTSLPWGSGPSWNTPDPAYELDRLVADVTRLLTPTLPVTARMETLRRATIYAARDKRVAADLLQTLTSQARKTDTSAVALFDAGFLTEAYRQASRVYKWDMLSAAERERWTLRDEPAAADGIQLIDAAIARAGQAAPDMRRARAMANVRK